MSWPAITVREALDLATKSAMVPDFEQRIAGDELEHARYAYAALQVMAEAYVELSALYDGMTQRAERLTEQIHALSGINEEMEELLSEAQAQNAPAEPIAPITVEWRGSSSAYFDHMSEINAEIAREWADTVDAGWKPPERPVNDPFAGEIDPGEQDG